MVLVIVARNYQCVMEKKVRGGLRVNPVGPESASHFVLHTSGSRLPWNTLVMTSMLTVRGVDHWQETAVDRRGERVKRGRRSKWKLDSEKVLGREKAPEREHQVHIHIHTLFPSDTEIYE